MVAENPPQIKASSERYFDNKTLARYGNKANDNYNELPEKQKKSFKARKITFRSIKDENNNTYFKSEIKKDIKNIKKKKYSHLLNNINQVVINNKRPYLDDEVNKFLKPPRGMAIKGEKNGEEKGIIFLCNPGIRTFSHEVIETLYNLNNDFKRGIDRLVSLIRIANPDFTRERIILKRENIIDRFAELITGDIESKEVLRDKIKNIVNSEPYNRNIDAILVSLQNII